MAKATEEVKASAVMTPRRHGPETTHHRRCWKRIQRRLHADSLVDVLSDRWSPLEAEKSVVMVVVGERAQVSPARAKRTGPRGKG